MAFMRRRVLRAGVTVLDHHPALELLSDGESVTGAAGLDRQRGGDWRVDAGAVVLATGGCAFGERILGATTLTGDGLLMAAEAGASLSGMEFTGKYTLAPHGSSLNKGLPFRWARFFREDGTPILDGNGEHLSNGIGERERDIVSAMIAAPVFAKLDMAEPALKDWLRRGQPNCFTPYDRMGIDPLQRFLSRYLQGRGNRARYRRHTHRHLRLRHRCRRPLCCRRCGKPRKPDRRRLRRRRAELLLGDRQRLVVRPGAAAHARRYETKAFRRASRPLGQAGLRPAASAKAGVGAKEIVDTVRAEVIPLEKNYFRDGGRLRASRDRLNSLVARRPRPSLRREQ